MSSEAITAVSTAEVLADINQVTMCIVVNRDGSLGVLTQGQCASRGLRPIETITPSKPEDVE